VELPERGGSPHHQKRREADRIRSANRRRRARAGRVIVLVELDEVNGSEWLGLRGETDRRVLQEGLQAFVDSEINVTRDDAVSRIRAA
jgi:hypothetical protein